MPHVFCQSRQPPHLNIPLGVLDLKWKAIKLEALHQATEGNCRAEKGLDDQKSPDLFDVASATEIEKYVPSMFINTLAGNFIHFKMHCLLENGKFPIAMLVY